MILKFCVYFPIQRMCTYTNFIICPTVVKDDNNYVDNISNFSSVHYWLKYSINQWVIFGQQETIPANSCDCSRSSGLAAVEGRHCLGGIIQCYLCNNKRLNNK